MAEPDRIPIEPGLVARVAQGFRYALTGVAPNGWFGPSQPLQPAAQEQAAGRAFDYPTGYNLQIAPRAVEPISFAQLRGLADGYDLMRLVIETRKDQIERLPWSVQFRDKSKTGDENNPRIAEVKARLQRPDNRLTWRRWARALLEDLLVIDAPAVYLRRTNGGKLFALDLIDGATIAPKIDDSGRFPLDGPAYQQVIKGVPACDYTAAELIYLPRNARTNKVYGFSPVEQIITTVNIALRRQISQLAYFTEGNIPPVLLSAPKDWSVDAIKQFEDNFNAMLSGNLAGKRRAKFVPDGTKPWVIQDSPLKDQFDDWLARVTCYAFSVAPQALVQMQNRSTAETGTEEAAKEGIEPLKLWLKDFADECIVKGFGYDDIEFVWSEEQAVDPKVQAEIHQIYVNTRVMTRNEARIAIGLDPVEGGDDFAQDPQPQQIDETGQDSPAPKGEAPQDGETEVGKAAGLPFGLRKFLPDTDQIDADGQVQEDQGQVATADDTAQKAALAAAILLLLIRWRKAVWREIGFIGVADPSGLSAWADRYAARTLDLVNATTAQRIRAGVADGAALDDVVSAVFAEAVDSRADTIAETISTAAFGFSALDAMQTAGVATAKWITERDGRVRPTHMAMDGQTRPVGMPFTSPSGAMAYHPGGFGVAAEDVNCRCHLVHLHLGKADDGGDATAAWQARERQRAKGAKSIARVIRRMFRQQKTRVSAG